MPARIMRTDAEKAMMILAAFRKSAARGRSPVWSRGALALHANLGADRLTPVLVRMVEKGNLRMVVEDFRSSPEGLLNNVYGVRSNIPYYMLPERYEELVAARDKRRQSCS